MLQRNSMPRVLTIRGLLSKLRLRILFSAEDLAANVRPDLFGDIVQCRRLHLRSPVAQRLAQPSLLRGIVGVGQRGLESVASCLRPVEAGAARIRPGNDGARERKAQPPEEASLAHGKVARILVGDDGNDGFCEVRSRKSVNIRSPVVAAIAGQSLSEVRIGFEPKALCGQNSGPDK